ncbi:CcdC protein domain-containing protein [Streptacidiphilus griseoplanus]|uniref:CcdC protein domain-containing protein n=1 Tax=Peterkaempfera griseoplana TaxID=66896 RepID=UPI0006E29884|nr:CcdC protein domain-containing protein [Peterkaempfera griseoplana]
MSGSVIDVLTPVAAVVLVLVRQFRARQVGEDRRVWLIPLVLAVLAFRDPQLIDPAHRTAAVALLSGEMLLAAASGCAWAWTTRIWRAADGTVWAKGTWASFAAWAGMVVVRIGLFGLGHALGVHQSSAGLLLSVAAMLLVRGALVSWRAGNLEPSYRVPAAG